MSENLFDTNWEPCSCNDKSVQEIPNTKVSTIDFDNNGDEIFGTKIKENLMPFFSNLLCKVHNLQFTPNDEERTSMIQECAHEIACFCDFLNTTQGNNILEYKIVQV